MNEMDKMLRGEPFSPSAPEIQAGYLHASTLCHQLNALPRHLKEERSNVIRQLFGSVGDNVWVQPGFNCDMGLNIHVGDNFFANYNVTILDMNRVTIGDNALIGPHVGIYAVSHSLDAAERNTQKEFSQPITIGDSVWIGGHACILMGVTIGNNVIIAAGSVVKDDIPDNAIVAGNPARIIRFVDND